METNEALKKVLLDATAAAGEIIRTRFQGPFAIEHKEGINNLVTEVDKAAETRIIEIIHATFPTHSILSEEIGTVEREPHYQWIIDPIDGTVNFAHGIPLCCVSIAVQKGGELQMGAVFNPVMNELFFAERGKGATLNGVPISVSKKDDFRRACMVTGFPYQWPEGEEHPIRAFERFIMQGLPVRRLGSAAIDLCWVACGRFDGFWEYNLSPWDIAAGILIVEEAGGRVSDFSGGPSSFLQKQTLASNGLLHEDIMNVISNKAGKNDE